LGAARAIDHAKKAEIRQTVTAKGKNSGGSRRMDAPSQGNPTLIHAILQEAYDAIEKQNSIAKREPGYPHAL
jgi:hypothetical protein